MNQLQAIRSFIKVVESGSFTKAADLLNIPKSTVSKHVLELEAYLKLALVQRTTRQISVTPEGAYYYDRMLQVLNEIDTIDQNVSSDGRTEKYESI